MKIGNSNHSVWIVSTIIYYMISFVRFHFMVTIKMIRNINRKKWTKIWTIYLFWLLHKFRIYFFSPHPESSVFIVFVTVTYWITDTKQNRKETVLTFCYKKDKLALIRTLTFSFSFSTFHKFIYAIVYGIIMIVVILTAALTLMLTMFGCLCCTMYNPNRSVHVHAHYPLVILPHHQERKKKRNEMFFSFCLQFYKVHIT